MKFFDKLKLYSEIREATKRAKLARLKAVSATNADVEKRFSLNDLKEVSKIASGNVRAVQPSYNPALEMKTQLENFKQLREVFEDFDDEQVEQIREELEQEKGEGGGFNVEGLVEGFIKSLVNKRTQTNNPPSEAVLAEELLPSDNLAPQEQENPLIDVAASNIAAKVKRFAGRKWLEELKAMPEFMQKQLFDKVRKGLI